MTEGESSGSVLTLRRPRRPTGTAGASATLVWVAMTARARRF